MKGFISWLKNLILSEPVAVGTVVSAAVGAVIGWGLNIPPAWKVTAITMITAAILGWARGQVTPTAHLVTPEAPKGAV